MLVAMSDVLRIKCENMETAYEIMESLQVMFGQPSDKLHHDAFKAAMNAKMKAGTSIREHVLKMINQLNEAEIHGLVIDERSQVSMILESLSLTFFQFKSTYVMNKLNYNTTQLLNERKTFESFENDKEENGEANVVDAQPSTSFNKNRKRKKKNERTRKP